MRDDRLYLYITRDSDEGVPDAWATPCLECHPLDLVRRRCRPKHEPLREAAMRDVGRTTKGKQDDEEEREHHRPHHDDRESFRRGGRKALQDIWRGGIGPCGFILSSSRV